MTYTLKDLGFWEVYIPVTLPPGAPDNAMFARRVSDGKDWYELAHDPTTWTPYSVTATLMPTPAGLLVQSAVRDASRIFPAGSHLIEIIGIDPAIEKPHKLFEQQICDIAAGTFAPPPATVPQTISDRQFFQLLAERGIITEAEALDAVGPGIMPKAMMALIDKLPQDKRFAAKMLVTGASTYERSSPFATLIGQLYGWSDADIDQAWRDANAL